MSRLTFVLDAKRFSEGEADGDIVWIKAAPWDSWDHPMFGTTDFTKERGERMVKHFHDNVRGHELSTDYEHGLDPAKGTKASGWVKDVAAKDDGFYMGVQFTETAKQEIENGEWKYFSYEFYDEWTHPHTKNTYQDVLTGGGLTNKPWIKGLPPINFSELASENDVVALKELNGAIIKIAKYIAGNPDDSGKTYAIDLISRAKDLMRGGEDMALAYSEIETFQNDYKKFSEEVMKDEVANQEHGEPGSEQSREDEKPGADHEPGTREDSPPVEPEAQVSDLDKQLREALKLDPDADIVKFVTEMHEEVEPLREVAQQHSEKKAFAEQYPEQAKRLETLEKESQESRAKAFSEKYAKFVVKEDEDGEEKETGYGFSALVLNKLESDHKKFSEGTMSVSDYRETIDLIASGKGLVQYSELGTSIFEDETDDDEIQPGNAAKQFAEKVAELRDKDNLDHREAARLAAEQNPELFKAYRDEVEVGR